MTFKVPNQYRVRKGLLASTDAAGLTGLFFVPSRPGGPVLKVIASDGEGLVNWEHVSVSLPDRCPTWDEMCRIKALFWDDEDTVLQLHPPKSQWVSNHQYCLHLWRYTAGELPMPNSGLVGDAALGTLK